MSEAKERKRRDNPPPAGASEAKALAREAVLASRGELTSPLLQRALDALGIGREPLAYRLGLSRVAVDTWVHRGRVPHNESDRIRRLVATGGASADDKPMTQADLVEHFAALDWEAGDTRVAQAIADRLGVSFQAIRRWTVRGNAQRPVSPALADWVRRVVAAYSLAEAHDPDPEAGAAIAGHMEAMGWSPDVLAQRLKLGDAPPAVLEAMEAWLAPLADAHRANPPPETQGRLTSTGRPPGGSLFAKPRVAEDADAPA